VPRLAPSAAALGCAILAACSFPADYSDTRYQCDLATECPPGYACVSGFCERPASGATGDGGGGGRDAGGRDAGGDGDGGADPDAPPGVCPSGSRHTDDFDTGLGWELTLDAGCDLGFAGGEVRMAASVGRCTARTEDLYDLDGRIWIQAVEPEDGELSPAFGVFLGDSSLVSMRTVAGLELVELAATGTDQQQLESIPFDAAEHLFWGFRPDGNDDTIFWETSPDGKTWTVQGEYRPAVYPEGGCMNLEIDVLGIGELGAGAVFDNLNLVP